MADQFPNAKKLYRVRFETRNGPVDYFVEAGGAVRAHQMGEGLAALDGLDHRGAIDVEPATEKEITDYYDTDADYYVADKEINYYSKVAPDEDKEDSFLQVVRGVRKLVDRKPEEDA